MSSQARRYGDLERFELLPEVMRCFLYGMVALLFLALGWCAVASVDVVAVAPARIVPARHVKIIQPDSNGVIDRVLVKEGEHVTAGSVMALLEPYTQDKDVLLQNSELAITRKKLDLTTKAITALKTVIANPELLPTVSANVDDSTRVISELRVAYVTWREAEFDMTQNADEKTSEMSAIGTQRASLSNKKELHQKALIEQVRAKHLKLKEKKLEIEQLGKLIAAAQKELTQVQLVLNATEQQEKAYAFVFKEGAVSKMDYLNMVKEAERTRREITQQETAVLELKKKLEIASAELIELNAENQTSLLDQRARIQDVSAEIGKIDALQRAMHRRYNVSQAAYRSVMESAKAKLTSLESLEKEQIDRVNQAQTELKHSQRLLSNSQIKAPVTGTVTGIKLTGKGQVVNRGERLLSIVPDSEALVFEAAIPNKDVGFIKAGQDVKIKLQAYPFEDFGILKGKVVHLEAASDMPSKHDAVFLARIAPERNYVIAFGEKRPLASGMSATCEIVCRKQRILDLLLKPVKQMKETRWQ